MKKIKLFLMMIFALLIIPNVYADNTIEEIVDIKKPPILSEKKYVYINNMGNYTITINDSSNFKTLKNNETGSTHIVLYNLPTSNRTYNNSFEIYWDKIGYYVDDNGNPVYLDAKVKINRIVLKYTSGVSNYNNHQYLRVAGLSKSTFNLSNQTWNDDFSHGGSYTGVNSNFTITLYNDDGSALSDELNNNLYLQWLIEDIDQPDASIIRNEYLYEYQGNPADYVESIKFTNGFDSKFYVRKDSVLRISENNTRFSATEGTGNDSSAENEKSKDYSTIIAYQTNDSAEAEWWGSDCATTIAAVTNEYPYPPLHEPTKSVEGDIYKVGERVDYTVNETFPYTDSHSKAKSIELIDTFDNALKVNEITYQVFDANNKDVTSDWEKTVSGQTVTLKYIGEDTATVYGNFTFKFNNLKVLDPDSSHEVKKENGVEYKIIPNKAKVTIVGANDDTSTKETNIVKIRVRDINNPNTGIKISLFIVIIISIFAGSLSIYYLINKKKIYLK